jgi:hypothetical protein
MTRDRLLEQAIELLAIADFHSITLKEERNQVVREGIELLRQPKRTEPVCPACKALQALHNENERLGLYKDAYGQPEQEPVAWMNPSWIDPNTRGWQSDSFESIPIEGWLPLYTQPPQRTWIGLEGAEFGWFCHTDFLNARKYTKKQREHICCQLLSEAQSWDIEQYTLMMHDSTKLKENT